MSVEKYPRFGRISSVFLDTDESTILLNVKLGPNQEPREVRYSTMRSGVWQVPSEGDMVEVHKISGGFVAKSVVTKNQVSFPSGFGEGDFCIKMDDSNQLYFSKQGDGSFDLEVTTDGNISVSSTGGNVDVSAPAGSVIIDGIDFEQHTHQYQDSTISDTSDGTGSSSSTQKQTGVPE